MGDTFVRINNVDEIKAAPELEPGRLSRMVMDWRTVNPPERIKYYSESLYILNVQFAFVVASL